MIAIACLLLTVGIYWGTDRLYQRFKRTYLSPVIIVPVLLIVGLLAFRVPFESYHAGTQVLTDLLGPATVAFAVPLYKYFQLLKKHALEMISSVLFGSFVAIVTSVLLAEWMQMDAQLIESMAPRSITTPIAMNVSQSLGGIPAITAVFVIMTGITGVVIGPPMIRLFRLRSSVSRGLLLGMGAHGIGTTRAFEFGRIEGVMASLAMIMGALFTLGMIRGVLGLMM
ncbi:Inner membrane protein YohK [Paenibacillus sp. CECT 9249]|uniref:LrgB family protein n=1 Tax=Paenibacillus sp. CECT 9249 TaxID=2845385 RepID=UPI001E30E0F1|nr:LrgB family protein [Paenibacillus sp. CECT 9249]CAH0117892.1 Inner membrane protein YohK [Paenibacillus sp. CECT 9249]